MHDDEPPEGAGGAEQDPLEALIQPAGQRGLTEGGVTVTVYSLVSKGCNEPMISGACPNTDTTSALYAERELSLTLTK